MSPFHADEDRPIELAIDELLDGYSDRIASILGSAAYAAAMHTFARMPRQRERATKIAERYMSALYAKGAGSKHPTSHAGWLADNAAGMRAMIVAAVQSNKPPAALADEIARAGLGNAETIARTELAAIQNEARMERMAAQGFDRVLFVAVPDERMCPDCGSLHMSVFDRSEAPKLPRHPNCRCTYVGYTGDLGVVI